MSTHLGCFNVFADAKKPHALHVATLMLTNKAAFESNIIKSRSQHGPDRIQPPRSFCASPTQDQQRWKVLVASTDLDGFGNLQRSGQALQQLGQLDMRHRPAWLQVARFCANLPVEKVIGHDLRVPFVAVVARGLRHQRKNKQNTH